MTELLPPLAAIRVFESAARHLSFTRAATELGMTQAAVSYQIKVLEERLGAPLFLRQPRALKRILWWNRNKEKLASAAAPGAQADGSRPVAGTAYDRGLRPAAGGLFALQ